MFGLGIWELLIVLAIIVVLFGAKRLPLIGGPQLMLRLTTAVRKTECTTFTEQQILLVHSEILFRIISYMTLPRNGWIAQVYPTISVNIPRLPTI